MNSPWLGDRSVLVTGGGTGIGAACAMMAARQGAKVTICGRTASKLDAIAMRIRAEGGSVHVVQTDVTLEGDVVRLIGEAVKFGGGLGGVIANAGGGGGLAPLHQQDVAEFLRVMHLNVLSTLLCIKHSVQHLARSGHGSFVGMSSLAGHVTHQGFGAYTVSKAGIETLVRNAADEYGAAGVRFNAIQPGFIATEVMEGITPGTRAYESYVSQTPLGGVGQPDDVASAACFLLSSQARWITGQVLAVDGGNSLRCGPDYSASIEKRFGKDAFNPSAS